MQRPFRQKGTQSSQRGPSPEGRPAARTVCRTRGLTPPTDEREDDQTGGEREETKEEKLEEREDEQTVEAEDEEGASAAEGKRTGGARRQNLILSLF
ncbi:UNVERIFIED_CONTAM: hypothetical protein HHA_462580 [Hammondia hammondi]|eukprot:XP_008887641.1 hypothetical protein HHA_462580 [Hammondia hammondi]